jgi:hypothetical protein
MAHYHSDDAPEDLKKAIHDGTFVDWYKNASMKQLEAALRSVHSTYAHYPLIQKEIDHRQRLVIAGHLADLKKRHWTLVPTFWIVLITGIFGVIFGPLACIIGYLAWRHPVEADPKQSETQSAPSNPSIQLLPNPQSNSPAQSKAPQKRVPPPTNSGSAPASPKK